MRIAHRVIVAGTAVVLSWGASIAPAQQPPSSPFSGAPTAVQPPAASPPGAAAQAGLEWLNNLDSGLSRAAAQRKLVLVHFWNDNCPPCVAIERNVFSRADVQQAIGANFVAVKIKVDDHPEIAKQFRIDRWPTDLVLTSDGRELYRTVTSQNPDQYLALLQRVSATAQGAVAGVRDAARTANQWADRVSNTIPQFGAGGAPAGVAPAVATGPAPPPGAVSAVAPGVNQGAGFAPPSAPAPPNAPPSPPPSASAAPPSAAPAASGIGLEGFCPVTLQATRKWRRGDARWGAVHRDRTYLFAGPEEQRVFLENPDKFAPMLSGYDPVRYSEQGQLVDGRRQHGVWYRNQMYLFADEATLERFWKNPDLVVPRVEQAMRATAGGVRR